MRRLKELERENARLKKLLAERDRIFDRFYRSPSARQHPGSGFGLAIVAQAAALHGGRVEVTDRPGGGAVFTLDLPEWPSGIHAP